MIGRDHESFESLMGFHAAPFLTGMRPSSLVSFSRKKFADIKELLIEYEPCFSCKGISYFCFSGGIKQNLVLFYRKRALADCLNEPGSNRILVKLGYITWAGVDRLLCELDRRMRSGKEFPHEIGLFLGYPPEDVAGFIHHRGKDFIYSGLWKIYANEDSTRKLFDDYIKCSQEFCRRLAAGASFEGLLAVC